MPSGALLALAVLLGAAGAAFTYLVLERGGRRNLPALVARAIAWSALLLLVLNLSCPAPAERREPLVLLDASLSMDVAGGRWRDARALADSLGEVRTFGDARPGADSLPDRGRSLVRPALTAAAASDRPVVVVTDGELEDARDLPPDLLERAAIHVVPRDTAPDLAITRFDAPPRVTAGEDLPVDLELRTSGGLESSDAVIAFFIGARELARRTVAFDEAGAARARVTVPTRGIAAGHHLVEARLLGHEDAESRTDQRLALVTIAATPGVVLTADPGDWDARTLFRTLRDVAQLPVRGYVQLADGRWQDMASLAPVADADVRRAARGADLLVLKGRQHGLAEGARARGLLQWPSGQNGEALLPGDWYLAVGDASPLAGAFLGLPVDSFAPAMRITPIQPGEGEWVALEAQDRRRGAARPVVTGRDEGRRRRMLVAVDGLWQWAFRGGSSEAAYRAWVAASVSWLLGGADSARGAARPLRPVVEQGRPVVFEWAGGGAPRDAVVVWSGEAGGRTDTLRFDGAGRAEAWLVPGSHRYRLADGGAGVVAVERYSTEFLPRPLTVGPRSAAAGVAAGGESVRDRLWLFFVVIAALAAEWFARRRLGLR